MSDFKVVNNQTEEEDVDYEKQVRAHRLGRHAKRTIAAAAIIAAVLFLFMRYKNMVYTEYSITSKSVRTDSETAHYMAMNGHVLKYSNDGAEAFDGANKALWNLTYEMVDPQVAYSDNYVAIADMDSTTINVMAMNGTSTTIKTKLPVVNFCISNQGVVAAVLEDSDNMMVMIYSKEGKELAGHKSTMEQSGYPIDIALSPDGKVLGISYSRINNNALCSTIAFFNFGDVGQNEIDNFVGGYDYKDEVFPRIRFLDDDAAVAVGKNSLVFFKGKEKPEALSANSIDDQIESVYFGDKKVALVTRSGNGSDAYRAHVFDKGGKPELTQDFDMAYTDIQMRNDLLLIYNDTKCEIYNMKGKKKYSGTFEDPTLLMVPTTSKARYILVNRNTVETIRLK